MVYAKLNNGIITYAPKSLRTENGQLIVNFNRNVELMKKYNYKEVLDIKPVFNKETQYLHVLGYREDEVNIFVDYEIIELGKPGPSLEDRVSALEQEMGNMTTMLIQTINKNDDLL